MSGSGKLLLGGFVLLLVGGIALWRMSTGDEATAGASRTGKPTVKNDEAAGDSASAPAPTVVDTAKGARAAPTPREAAPALVGGVQMPKADEIQYRPDGVPIPVADLDTLQAATAPIDNLVRDCIKTHGGADVSGTVITTFVVARKKDTTTGKFTTEVESTGFEEEGSTIKDPKFIECVQETARQMKFPPNRSPVASWARRNILVEKGVLKENWVFQYGHIR